MFNLFPNIFQIFKNFIFSNLSSLIQLNEYRLFFKWAENVFCLSRHILSRKDSNTKVLNSQNKNNNYK